MTSDVILRDSLPSLCLINPGCFSSIEKFINILCKLFERLLSEIFKPNKSALPNKSSSLSTSNFSKYEITSFAMKLNN